MASCYKCGSFIAADKLHIRRRVKVAETQRRIYPQSKPNSVLTRRVSSCLLPLPTGDGLTGLQGSARGRCKGGAGASGRLHTLALHLKWNPRGSLPGMSNTEGYQVFPLSRKVKKRRKDQIKIFTPPDFDYGAAELTKEASRAKRQLQTKPADQEGFIFFRQWVSRYPCHKGPHRASFVVVESTSS